MTETEFLSTFGYFMLVEAGFIFGMLYRADDIKRLLRIATLSSYSVFAVAVIIAVTALTEDGSGLEILAAAVDVGADGNGKKRKSKKLKFD